MSKKVSKKNKETKEEEVKDSDLLAPETKEDKPKILLGFHPITGEEVWG